MRVWMGFVVSVQPNGGCVNGWMRRAIALLCISLGCISLSPALAQTSIETTVEPAEDGLEEALEEGLGEEDSEEMTGDRTRISLSLPQFIEQVLEDNRELQNAFLERIVQEQELAEAESIFRPNLTPRLSAGVTQRLDDQDDGFLGEDTDRTTTDESLGLTADALTPIGTDITVELDPLADEVFQVNVRQPLLRGAGRERNRAPITQARLVEEQNQLALEEQTIETLNTAITAYTNLIRQQESVRIQQDALERRQAQLTIITALVEAGRLPRIDLVQEEGNIATAERDLRDAQNNLAQANTNLLDLLGSDASIQFVASLDDLTTLYQDALTQIPNLSAEELLDSAYQLRPDYQSAQLEIAVAESQLQVTEDEQRWQLDLEGSGSVGDTSEVRVGLLLTRTFEDESLETARQRSQIGLEQSENNLDQLTTSIRNEVANRLDDVRSNQLRLEAAQRATAAAELQLESAREQFRRGRGNITLLDLSQREESLVQTQNAELEAQIALFDSLVELEQAIGQTLILWGDRLTQTAPPDE
ncbi:TolC family protein [Vacuolonema iberomarrocanum]|uniref:TolC family protein n=1 Tax=Vacuolonema iberomarrocanum TaxID=3454632 RepID=UPI0019E5F776|nr:TolC family protein [filamentous cyanobacterium LEGE 07170]